MNWPILHLLSIAWMCASMFGQAARQAQTPTFHVRGTVTDPLGAVVPRVKVTFRQGAREVVVNSNAIGGYQTDLPVGSYSMTAESKGFRTYRRPLFRVMSTADVRFDILLPVGRIVDRVERPATSEEIAAAQAATTTDLTYYSEQTFSAPAPDGVPYEVYIRYVRGTRTQKVFSYTGEKLPYEDPVFVAYNCFSLVADQVTYDTETGILNAHGSVVARDGCTKLPSGATSFKIADGRVIPVVKGEIGLGMQ